MYDVKGRFSIWASKMERDNARIAHNLKARSGTDLGVDKRESCNEELKNLG